MAETPSKYNLKNQRRPAKGGAGLPDPDALAKAGAKPPPPQPAEITQEGRSTVSPEVQTLTAPEYIARENHLKNAGM